MRKILFRGKRIDSGEWVEGHYGEYMIMSGESIPCISIPNKEAVCGSTCYDVEASTVGQYTGLTDKNGTRVFEGDILKIIDKYQSPFDDDTNEYTDITTDVVHFDDEGLCFSYGKSPFLCVADNVTAEYEVIGNIHDNPELLEVAK